ncbi:MAG: isochorismatase family protein [Acidimicrobiia bacterium]|nr:isochorismatase family protein [Acidimicrobiia bacterium]
MTSDNGRAHWSDRLPPEDAAALAGYSSSSVIVPDAPAPVLMVIDVVESFVGPNVPILEAQQYSRKACGDRAWAAIPGILSLIDAFRERGLPIIFTRADPLQAHAGPATRRPDAARDASLSNEFIAEASPQPEDIVLTKVRASAFYATPLQSLLTKLGHRTVVLTGCTTSGCVRATAVDGTSAGFNVLVADDAVYDRSGISHDVSLIDINAKYGSVMPSADIIALLDD